MSSIINKETLELFLLCLLFVLVFIIGVYVGSTMFPSVHYCTSVSDTYELWGL